VDAIEVYNSRCMLPRFNREAAQFARRLGLVGTVGSDAHAAFELGRALMMLELFEGPEGMRNAIRTGKQKVRWSPPWYHLVSRYAVIYKKVTGGLDITS
jgi:PHP-associated